MSPPQPSRPTGRQGNSPARALPVRILYIHQYFSTPAGAVGTRSHEFASRLAAAGHQVTMLCGRSKWARADGVAGFRVLQVAASASNSDSLPRRTWGFLAFSVFSTWHALRMDYDVVYATSTPLTVAIPGILARHLRHRKFVFEVRDLWPELPKAMGVLRDPVLLWLLRKLEHLAYRSADACIGLSPGIVAGIRRSGKARHVVEISNGCDLDTFRPEPRKGLSCPGIGPDNFVAIFCGAHGRANGLDALLDVAAELRRRGNRRIRLLLVGDGQMKPRLVQRAARQQLDNVVFMNPVPKVELAKLMGRCHVGLMILADVDAFRYGTSPNKFFDYIASGLPVVCNYPGWLADLVATNRCGYSTPPGDAAKLADILESLAADSEGAARMGANARWLAETEFSRDKLFQRLQHTLERVLAG